MEDIIKHLPSAFAFKVIGLMSDGWREEVIDILTYLKIGLTPMDGYIIQLTNTYKNLLVIVRKELEEDNFYRLHDDIQSVSEMIGKYDSKLDESIRKRIKYYIYNSTVVKSLSVPYLLSKDGRFKIFAKKYNNIYDYDTFHYM